MLFSRYAVARVLAAASLIAPACGGILPPLTQPARVFNQQPVYRSTSTRASQVPARSSGTIAGVVRSASAPIARARVTLASPVLTAPRVAITAADGTYRFEKLPPGVYTIQASSSGYATQFHKQRPNAVPSPVALADGQRLTNIDVTLPPAGVIVGRILDEDGRPFTGANVEALVSRMENGQAALVSLANTVTDDRGEFRLAGLAEGQYYVSAFDPAFAHAGDDTGPLRYSATYYPGVVLVEDARRVSVTPAVEPKTPVVFALKIVRPARISGTIATPDRKQLTSGAVLMAPLHGERFAAVPSDDVRINPDGTFTFRNVAPGRYYIRARAEAAPRATALFAAYQVAVNGRDIDNIEMVLRPGAMVEGTVTFDARETTPPRTFSGIRVRAPFADGSTFGDASPAEVASDGTYRIRGLMAGRHYLTVEGLEHPWVMKDVVWRGEDVTDAALEVNAQQVLDNVRVTITDVANDVTGTVRDARGEVVPDALVLVMPLAPQFWTRTSRRFAMLRTDSRGRYGVRGLPAGEYRAVASLELDESDISRRDLLREFAHQGQPLTLSAPRPHVVDLSLTSLARSKRTSGL